jgi:hypothetical protein
MMKIILSKLGLLGACSMFAGAIPIEFEQEDPPSSPDGLATVEQVTLAFPNIYQFTLSSWFVQWRGNATKTRSFKLRGMDGAGSCLSAVSRKTERGEIVSDRSASSRVYMPVGISPRSIVALSTLETFHLLGDLLWRVFSTFGNAREKRQPHGTGRFQIALKAGGK